MITQRLGTSNLSSVLSGNNPVSTLQKTAIVSFDEKTNQHLFEPLNFRVSAFERWAGAAEVQNRGTLMQIAEIALLQGLKILKEMDSIIPKALVQNEDATAKLQNLREMLCQLQPSYLGIQLFDNNLNLKRFSRRSKRNFKFKMVDILTPKPRDEILTFFVYNNFKMEPVCVTLPANASPEILAKVINQSLQPFGLKVSSNIKDLNNDSPAIFSCDDEIWDTIKLGVMLLGQGQRLPAGKPRQIQIEEVYSWQNPKQWRLTNAVEIRDSHDKIQKTTRKLEKQLSLCRHEQKILKKDINLNKTAASVSLTKLTNQLKNARFSKRLNALVAQANISAKQSMELLK